MLRIQKWKTSFKELVKIDQTFARCGLNQILNFELKNAVFFSGSFTVR